MLAIPDHAVQVQVVQVFDYVILQMKALRSLETSVAIYRSTQRNKPENFDLQQAHSSSFDAIRKLHKPKLR